MNEKMSAWMDDELNRFEERALVASLENDAELRGRWERYHLAREAIHQELTALAPAGFADRVAAELRRAPAVFPARRWARLAGTAAIAASVAVIALVGIQFFPGPQAPGQLATSPSAPVRTVAAHWKTRQPEQARNLNIYLVEHNEFSTGNSVGGMLPYVRTVSQGEDAGAK